MFGMMSEYYDNILWDNFIVDLRKKDEAILLCDDAGAIHGFTTLASFDYDPTTRLLFSGDTVIEQEHWGNNDLTQIWSRRAFALAGAFGGKTYWLLMTKGYKTYKYLHTFFNCFYPRADTETTRDIQAIIDNFAKMQYGEKYRNGVITAGRDFLKDEFAAIDEAKLKDRNTAFFLEKNPNYKNGDELVCLCEISANNLNKYGRRALGE
jgi:hypothetical protein